MDVTDCLNVELHVNLNRQRLTANMRGLENRSKEEKQEERLVEARKEKELFRGAIERREQLDQEEIPLELQSYPRILIAEQFILDNLEGRERQVVEGLKELRRQQEIFNLQVQHFKEQQTLQLRTLAEKERQLDQEETML